MKQADKKEAVCMDNEKKENLQWLPLLITLCCAAITLLIYILCIGQNDYVIFLQVISAALIPAILPIVSYATKGKFPLVLNLLFSIHIVLAVDLGCAMSFYDRFYWWDMLMHGCFGLIASMSFYILLLKWNGGKLKRFGFFILIFLSTMGCAAIWEIFEFTWDQILDIDAQRVMESIAMGHTPVYDTMMDIIVAIAGIAVFYISLLIDSFCKSKLGKSLYERFVYIPVTAKNKAADQEVAQ